MQIQKLQTVRQLRINCLEYAVEAQAEKDVKNAMSMLRCAEMFGDQAQEMRQSIMKNAWAWGVMGFKVAMPEI